jgi:hypothetical protein
VIPLFPAPRRPLALALGTSLALHALLVAGLVAILAQSSPAPRALDAPLTARLASSPPAPPSSSVAAPAEAAPTHTPREALQPPARARALPMPKTKPAPVVARELVNVSHHVDAEAPLGEAFSALLATELAGLARVGLEFEVAPVIDVPAEAMRGIAQWRIRVLLRVTDAGGVELVRAADYEPRLVLAISNALDRSRARPAGGAATIEPGYAIVDFWFELAAGDASAGAPPQPLR